MSITKWSAAGKAVSQGLEFGFCFHTVDMASPLSGLQDRAVAKSRRCHALNGNAPDTTPQPSAQQQPSRKTKNQKQLPFA